MSIKHKEGEPEIKIELATSDDARSVTEVFYKTWLATYPNEKAGITVDDIEDRFKDSFTEEGLAKRAESIAHPKEGSSLLVAKADGKVIGICRAVKRPDKNQLQTIYILPEYQGKGIGGLLWEGAQKYFDPDKDTIVQVAAYNEGAINFYKKLGFEATDKHWEDKRFKMKSGAVIPETEMIIKKAK